jgi:hypothetical protein
MLFISKTVHRGTSVLRTINLSPTTAPPPTSSTYLKFYNVKILSTQYSDLSDTFQFFWSGIAITKLD